MTLARGGVWLATVALALALGELFRRLAVPGALLVGPLIAGILVAVSGRVRPPRVPGALFTGAQAAIGTLVATAFTPRTLPTLAHDAVPLVAVVATTLAAAAATGWVVARVTPLDPATAAWGANPGGAAAVVAMSLAEGADARLVALQQYLRVTLVVLCAAGVARAIGTHPAAAVPAAAAAAPRPAALLAALAVAALGPVLARAIRLPGAAILGPMLLGGALAASGLVTLAVPQPVLIAAYVIVGLAIGTLYTRATLVTAARALPWLVGATLLLIALCAGSAAILVATLRIDPLTAYLATTPGGIDAIAVIALGSGANVATVLALQAVRLVAVLLAGPAITRLVRRLA